MVAAVVPVRSKKVQKRRGACLEAATLQDMAVCEASGEDGKGGELMACLVWMLEDHYARASLEAWVG